MAVGNFSETDSCIIFDDSISLMWRNSPPVLTELIVFHLANGAILGLQGKYKVDEKTTIDGPLNYT